MAGYTPSEYPLGGGVLEIGKWDSTTPPTYPDDYIDIGDVQELTIQPNVEKVEHRTANFGVGEKDAEDITQTSYSLKIKLGQTGVDQLAMFVLGTKTNNYTITPMTNLDQEYALKYTPAYVRGELWEYNFWRVKITPSGALALVNPSEYGVIELDGEGLADRVNHESNPFWELVLPTA